MICPETAKPATESVNGLRNLEQLGGQLDLIETQTIALRKHFALGYCLAAALAPLIYGADPRDAHVKPSQKCRRLPSPIRKSAKCSNARAPLVFGLAVLR